MITLTSRSAGPAARMQPNRRWTRRGVSASRSGFALILVLCFVVLVCILVLAYMSHATLNREISRGSAAGSRADLLAQGAIDSILGDLKSEIVAGSIVTQPAPPSTAPPYYTPIYATNAVPYEVGTNPALPNLVKISTTSPFYPGGPTRACSDVTTNASFNQRAVSTARWNEPLLMPAKSATDSTPPASASFTAPNWILVARDGSNPTAVGSNVIGRYAYAIYDEGGLLDLNVAGYPSTSQAAKAAQVVRKLSLAYADLTQIPGMTSDAINTLVGWRNNASAQPSGTFPTFSFADPPSAYFTAVDGNLVGFLTTANTSLNGGASDQMFTSRQQLINFFNNVLGASSNADLQGSLQYFGTFSRDLNQPSYAPVTARPHTPSTDTSYSGNNSDGNDDTINPALLSIRVTQGTLIRNDGSKAVVGEPLVKKRFALNRLAWLTYLGPSASRSSGDPDMAALQTGGIPLAFLQQGTAANITSYFGLTWHSDSGTGYWSYDQGMPGTSGGGTNVIGTLKAVRDSTSPTREANFFEILKAGLTAGSLGKAATNPNGSDAEKVAFTYDQNLDYSVLQIGANIIAQSTTDGYPPRIRFNNGVDYTREFRGIKNLPYLYRLRSDIVISKLPDPLPSENSPSSAPGVTPPSATADPDQSPAKLNETGSYAVFFQPELWNPHDANCALGTPRPTQFRIVADAALLDGSGAVQGGGDSGTAAIMQTQMMATSPVFGSTGPFTPSQMDTSKESASDWYVNNKSGLMPSSTAWAGDNTALTFTDNNGGLFREPTLLAEPNKPNSSNLALGSTNALRTFYSQSGMGSYAFPANGSATTLQGVACLNDAVQPDLTPVPYLGFFVGTGPLRWVQSSTDGSTSNFMTATQISAALPAGAETYRVQYTVDGTNWITYDEKYIDPIPFAVTPHLTNGTNPGDLKVKPGIDTSPAGDPYNNAIGSGIGSGMSMTTADPRTRRFGAVGDSFAGPMGAPASSPYSASTSAGSSPPDTITTVTTPGVANNPNANYSFWSDQLNNVLMSDRPDAACGVGWINGSVATTGLPFVGGWYPAPSSGWLQSSSNIFYRPGLLSQNNPSVVSDGPQWLSASAAKSAQFFGDPDGVVRRAMGGYVPDTSTTPSTTVGLPMASTVSLGRYGASTNQSQSRPIVLNRPFRSVAELGYVFSGTPWRNLDMSAPESGAAPLLDLFCIQPDDNPSPLVAGKVDLNTRQEPVLTAILAGAYADELTTGGNNLPALPQDEADQIAKLLIARTTDTTDTGKGPLTNLADLVGKYQSSVATTTTSGAGAVDGSASYTGFSADLTNEYTSTLPNPTKNNIERFREAAIRPLAAVGTTRVWNLMIDLIAQTGRYPSTAGGLSDFFVEGESRYWLHVAIDRQTGQVIDEQLEGVNQ